MPKNETKLDDADRLILDILQSHGRITNSKLAEQLGMSPSPMLERVRKLEKSGIIERYVALLAPEKVGKTFAFVSVSLAVHQLGALDHFKQAIHDLPEVLECHHITGEDDFILKVAVSGIDDYRDFVVNKLTPISGINKIRTSFVLDTVKYTTKIDVK